MSIIRGYSLDSDSIYSNPSSDFFYVGKIVFLRVLFLESIRMTELSVMKSQISFISQLKKFRIHIRMSLDKLSQ